MLGANARNHGILGGTNAAEFGYIAQMTSAHFGNEHIIIFKIRVVYGEREPHGSVVGTRRGEHAVLFTQYVGKYLFCACFAVTARYTYYFYIGVRQLLFRLFYETAVVRDFVNFAK